MCKKAIVLSLFLLTGFFNSKAQLVASFAANVTHGCGTLQVQFTNLSTGNPTNFSWDFGNGKTASVVNPFVVYDRPGLYTVYLRVSTGLLSDDTLAVAYITVDSLPKALFNYLPVAGCIPLDIQFKDSSLPSTGIITSWSWNFGDGTISSLPSPLHTYSGAGSYSVSLIAGNSRGCFDTLVIPSAVATGTKPVASFNAKPLSSCASDPINFINTTTGTTTSYLWQFGDGDTSTKKGPLHNFTDTGFIDVTLIATYNGCSDTNAKAGFIYIKPPYVSIRSLLNCDSPYVRNFQMKFLGEKGFLWDFGDGTTDSINKFPRHVYATPGTYLVKLTAFGTECSFTDIDSVNIIDEQPSLAFAAIRSDICKYDNVRFNAANYNPLNIQSFAWDFGDGSKVTGFNGFPATSHVFDKAGTFYPLVITTDKNGCADTSKPTTKLIVSGPVAKFSSNKSVCLDYSNLFTDESTTDGTHTLVNWVWDYGDGKTDSLLTPPFTHAYHSIDTFNVKLSVTDAIGCKDSIVKNRLLFTVPRPLAKFFTVDSVSCFRDSVQFIDQSLGSALSHNWNFDDGFSSTLVNPSHVYAAAGIYDVSLAIMDNLGCGDTARQKIRIAALPPVDAGIDSFICSGSGAVLHATGGANYNWFPDPSLSCANCASPVVKPLKTTKYFVTGIDSIGCVASDSVLLKVIQPLKISVVPALDTVCIGTSTQLLAKGADSYTWSPTLGLNSTSINNPVATPSLTTVYTVIGSDKQQCFKDSASVKIIVSPYPVFNIVDTAVTVAGGSNFLIKTSGSPDIISWKWTPVTDLSCADCAQPLARANKIINYTAVATNSYGCSVSDHVVVRGMCDGTNIFIPNTFSPNGDNVNDKFYPRGNGLFLIKSMRIFNRIGQLVFQKLNFPADVESEGWDGTYYSKPVSPGVYMYFIEVICNDGVTWTFKGDVTVL